MNPTGVDVEVLELVFQHLDSKLLLKQGKWDDMVAYLRLGELDCIGGMEINAIRRDYFDFTTPYYNRKIVVFVRQENEEIQSIDDLIYRVIAGDRHSFVDNYFKEKGLRTQIRIRNTKSKDESMRMLRDNEVVAMVAPVAVGIHLAKRYNVAVRIIDNEDPGSPVGIAVEKGNVEFLKAIEEALVATMNDGTLEEVLCRWKIH